MSNEYRGADSAGTPEVKSGQCIYPFILVYNSLGQKAGYLGNYSNGNITFPRMRFPLNAYLDTKNGIVDGEATTNNLADCIRNRYDISPAFDLQVDIISTTITITDNGTAKCGYVLANFYLIEKSKTDA